eukprot:TRINITY_DN5666_c0_g3_i1.p1 TRINITY_DN5666_c0_g3~~TRINITY_DN5666_c0_g3_i1.p1  ORF type:complete len:189 (-),score=21.13 TRINITY_DN5666_c0_g3_i1:41-550(-)
MECSACQNQIPQHNFTLHQIHCFKRHNIPLPTPERTQQSESPHETTTDQDVFYPRLSIETLGLILDHLTFEERQNVSWTSSQNYYAVNLYPPYASYVYRVKRRNQRLKVLMEERDLVSKSFGFQYYAEKAKSQAVLHGALKKMKSESGSLRMKERDRGTQGSLTMTVME